MSENNEKNMDNLTQEQISKLWDAKHKFYDEKDKIVYDDWLCEFEELIEKVKHPVIDLGCGSGNNTLWLTEHGKDVVACDFSEQAIETVRKYIPSAKTLRFDMTQGLPFENDVADLIVADLSLHYFNEEVTFFVLSEIKRVLKAGGRLLFRVNSVNDINHGAMTGKELEHHLFFTHDMPKRFF